MKITITCENIENINLKNYEAELTLEGISSIDVDLREIEDLIDLIGLENVLDAIGKSKVVDHFGINESEE